MPLLEVDFQSLNHFFFLFFSFGLKADVKDHLLRLLVQALSHGRRVGANLCRE